MESDDGAEGRLVKEFLTEDEAIAFLKSGAGEMFTKQVGGYIAPLGWARRDKNGAADLRNGTCFFVQTPDSMFGVTANHVVQGFQDYCDGRKGITCQIGNVPIPLLDRILSRGRDVDIATFSISRIELTAVGKVPIDVWPPMMPEQGRGIMYGGYPGKARLHTGPIDFNFGMAIFQDIARGVYHDRISSRLEHDKSVDILRMGIPPSGYDIGGMSGGAMLALHDGLVMSLRLCGVIVEGKAEYDLVYAARADYIDSMGQVNG
jgi:hypothetical protein